ncbi:MAG: hypothetical protein HWN66_07940 [Candidatus Helarchaeota archaeon]|nr:hypothetical protein [Candidatus Helarchaeota archaeon]
MAWSPDSNLLASASDDNIIRLWDRDGQCIKQLKGHKSLVYFLEWAPDGSVLASVEPGSEAGGKESAVIGFWYRNGKLITWQRVSRIRALAWSIDGKFLASGSSDKMIRLWDKKGKLVRVLKGHSGSVHSLAFSPTTGLLASSSANGEIFFWDKEFNYTKAHHGGTQRDILKLRWSPDGKLLTSFGDRKIFFWSEDGERIRDLIDVVALSVAHTEDIIDLLWTSDGKLLASVSWDRTIRLWDRNGRCFRLLKIFDSRSESQLLLVPRSISWHSEGTILASTFNDGILRFWDKEGEYIGTGRLNLLRKTSLPVISKHSFITHDMVDYEDKVLWSPDGKILAIWERNCSSIVLLEWIISSSEKIITKTREDAQLEEILIPENESFCPICRQNISSNDSIIICHFCGSFFHIKCILKWVLKEKHIICPHCNNLFIRK